MEYDLIKHKQELFFAYIEGRGLYFRQVDDDVRSDFERYYEEHYPTNKCCAPFSIDWSDKIK